ncbi:MAG TPA: N-acetylgalactosamine 6-sulfate sulfatase, partial [Verrucomicrobiales bacterium]|nr:N-acetylgalactosamine 6-sulfate sulfatase [Verrucomicrobiales bacterium]
PAVLEWPGRVKANRITDINANTSDIYPTLLELAGVALPNIQPRLDGISLAPLLRGEKQVRKQPMGFWTYHNRGYGRQAR